MVLEGYDGSGNKIYLATTVGGTIGFSYDAALRKKPKITPGFDIVLFFSFGLRN
jgi:hypothetical protein